jgi:hypothetical protein
MNTVRIFLCVLQGDVIPYERERELRIERNKQLLLKLGLVEAASAVSALQIRRHSEKPRARPKKRQRVEGQGVRLLRSTRRSARLLRSRPGNTMGTQRGVATSKMCTELRFEESKLNLLPQHRRDLDDGEKRVFDKLHEFRQQTASEVSCLCMVACVETLIPFQGLDLIKDSCLPSRTHTHDNTHSHTHTHTHTRTQPARLRSS